MVTISFFAGEAFFAVLWLLARVLVWRKQNGISWKRETALFPMYVNLSVLILFTFFLFDRIDGIIRPLTIDPDMTYPVRMNLVPLKQLFWYEIRREMYINIIGNIVMFIPTGYLLAALFPKLNTFWKVAFAGAFISLCIELIQLLVPARGSDIDDVILNTAGTMIGCFLFILSHQSFRIKRLARKGEHSWQGVLRLFQRTG